MTWHEIMAYAHQGVEIKPIPGVAPGPTPTAPKAPVVADNDSQAADAPPPRPTLLTRRAADVLLRVEHLMDDATRALASTPGSPPGSGERRGASLTHPETFAESADRPPAGLVRGN
jgi:penicillin-binding protein 1A